MFRAIMFFWATLFLIVGLVQGASAQAQQTPASQRGPAEVVSDVTADVMQVVAEANSYFDEYTKNIRFFV